ncbi:MAG: hypothetical protein H6626_03725 [Pseudobdellovibrionaceae bacterium]|nr:MAG: hypothetical protein H6626_03725 [Pseudobdellovibrionaceae bacterium]
MLRPYLIAVFFLFFSPLAFSSEVVDVNYSGVTSTANRSSAKQQMETQAIEEVSLKYIKEIVGEAKTARNMDLIRSKIIKNSSKYVLTMNSGSMAKEADGWAMPVSMKLSLSSLQKMLLNEGLLYDMEGLPQVLPLIRVVDRVNSQGYSWWSEAKDQDNALLAELNMTLWAKMKEALWDKGFYGLSPVENGFLGLVPQILQVTTPQKDDALIMGEYFNSPIVVRGEMSLSGVKNAINTYRIDLRLEALHSGNGRVVGEVIRSYETDAGDFRQVVHKRLSEAREKVGDDLAVQVLDAWKRGTFGSSLVKLVLAGSLNYKDLNLFKQTLVQKVKPIKTARERLFEPERVTFELDASANPQQLAELITKSSFAPLKVQVSQVRTDGIELTVSHR